MGGVPTAKPWGAGDKPWKHGPTFQLHFRGRALSDTVLRKAPSSVTLRRSPESQRGAQCHCAPRGTEGASGSAVLWPLWAPPPRGRAGVAPVQRLRASAQSPLRLQKQVAPQGRGQGQPGHQARAAPAEPPAEGAAAEVLQAARAAGRGEEGLVERPVHLRGKAGASVPTPGTSATRLRARRAEVLPTAPRKRSGAAGFVAPCAGGLPSSRLQSLPRPRGRLGDSR